MRRAWLGGLVSILACAGSSQPADRTSELLHDRLASAREGVLFVASAEMTDAEFATLMADERIPALTELSVDNNRLTERGVLGITTSPKTQAMRVLSMGENPIGDPGVEMLAKWPGLASLQVLLLGSTGMHEGGVRALVSSPHAAALDRLQLSFNDLGDTGAVTLARMHRLTKVDVEKAGIGGVGARALLTDAPFSTLEMPDNPVGPGGLVGLTAVSPTIGGLTLQKCALSEVDAVALAAVPAPSLRHLDLDYNALGDVGVRAIAQAPWLASLETLAVLGSGASPEARVELVAAWGDRPGLSIER